MVRQQKRQRAYVRQALFLVGIVALLSSAGAYVWIQKPLERAVTLERELAENIGRIMTLDEVLTMSAKMAASSGNQAYQQRYDDHVDELDRLIKATVGLSDDSAVRDAVQSTDEANRRLVDMETRSFELNKQHQSAASLGLLESREYRNEKATYAAGMTKAFELLQNATIARRHVVKRWATFLQLLAVFSLAGVVGAWALEQRERRWKDAAYAAELEAQVVQRTEELVKRNEAMRLVLDSVQQGLVGVDLQGWMASERSAVLERWFGPVEGQTKLADYLRSHDPAFAAWFELGLDQIQEGILPPDLCIEQMPRQLVLGSRTFSVDFEQTVTDGRCDGLLVVMADVTAELERERVEAEQRDLVRVLELLGKDPNGFGAFLGEANAIVEALTTGQSIDRVTQLRLIHTLKGNAAQFGMSVVAGVCHDIESRMAELDAIPARDLARLDGLWRAMKDRILLVAGTASSVHLAVTKSDYENVVQLVGGKRPHDDILQAMLAWIRDPIEARLERLADYGRALAERLGKPGLVVQCNAHGLRCDGPSWASFWSVCVHLVRNAVDHGIEPASVRSSEGKPEAGRLTLTAELQDDALVVCFADDGRGIDWNKLRSKADELGLATGSEAELVEALFEEGVTCRDQVTDVSGRGVGMGAVRAEVQRRGGALRVRTEAGSGVTVELRLPAEGVFSPALVAANLRASLAPARQVSLG
jgi:HPt (histidine-containing phosphotransfer) domain-containing protein